MNEPIVKLSNSGLSIPPPNKRKSSTKKIMNCKLIHSRKKIIPPSICSVTVSVSLLFVVVPVAVLLFCVEGVVFDVAEGVVAEFGFTNVAPGINRPVIPCTILPSDRAKFEKSKLPAATPGILVAVGIAVDC